MPEDMYKTLDAQAITKILEDTVTDEERNEVLSAMNELVGNKFVFSALKKVIVRSMAQHAVATFNGTGGERDIGAYNALNNLFTRIEGLASQHRANKSK